MSHIIKLESLHSKILRTIVMVCQERVYTKDLKIPTGKAEISWYAKNTKKKKNRKNGNTSKLSLLVSAEACRRVSSAL